MSPFITASNISIRVGTTFLFDGDSWHMNKGEHWAIVGPNGSGKSSFVKALAGKLSLRAGSIVFHSGNTVSYVSFDLYKKTITREQQQAEFLSMMGKESDTPLSALSTGQLRKKLLMNAFAKKPDLLILDEPFDGLDALNVQLLTDCIEHCIDTGTHVVLVTHHPEEIFSSITHVMTIAKGHIVRQEPYTPLASKSRISVSSTHSSHIFHTSSPKELIAMKNVTVRFGNTVALNNITWSLHEGERWAICGRNGAGKSTLASLIVGDEPQAYAQDIRIFGHQKGSGESIWDIKKHIGYISTGLHLQHQDDILASQVIVSGLYDTVGLYRAPSSSDINRLEEWAARLHIEDLIKKRFLSLSTGQQRLVLIARCLIKSPKLIIADEPCHGLDSTNRVRALEMFESACQNGSNLLFITHRTDELIPSISHILLLENGTIKAAGRRGDLMHIHF